MKSLGMKTLIIARRPERESAVILLSLKLACECDPGRTGQVMTLLGGGKHCQVLGWQRDFKSG